MRRLLLFHELTLIDAAGRRLRALLPSRMAEILLDEAAQDGQQISLDTVVFRLMEAAGHSSAETLRHYVKLANKLCLQRTGASSLVDFEQKRVAIERQVRDLERRRSELLANTG